MKEFRRLLDDYCAILTGGEENQVPFVKTLKFEEVFGEIPGLKEGIPALRTSNLDASPANLLLGGDGVTHLIDYEWVFDFPIPRDFVLFRHLHFLYAEPSFSWSTEETFGSLLEPYTESIDLKTLFAMHEGFQRYVCVEDGQTISCQDVFTLRLRPNHETTAGAFREPQHFVFLDRGNGLNEQDKLLFPGSNGALELTVDVDDVTTIRFDPFEGRKTMVEDLEIVTDSGESLPYGVPARTDFGDRSILDVPANVLVAIPEGTKKVTIQGFLMFLGERDEFWIGAAQDSKSRHEEERARLKLEFDQQMEQAHVEFEQTLHEQEEETEGMKQALEAALEAERSHSRDLETIIEEMRNSTSWKMTGWVRRLGSVGKQDR